MKTIIILDSDELFEDNLRKVAEAHVVLQKINNFQYKILKHKGMIYTDKDIVYANELHAIINYQSQ